MSAGECHDKNDGLLILVGTSSVLGCVSDTPTLHSSSFQEIAFLLSSKI